MNDINPSEKHKKIILLGFFFLLLISISFLLPLIFYNDKFTVKKSTNSNIPYDPLIHYTNISLSVDFGNGTVDYHQNITICKNASSVFDLLQLFYEIGYESYSYGLIITSINNVENNIVSNYFWFFWVNEEYSNIGASNYQLNDSDRVYWAYRNANDVEDFQF
ncbi:MAG: DUF4430 domain-containing protein [Promethearchaeota archaeon]